MIYVFNLMFLLLQSLLEERPAVCVYLSGDNGIITDNTEGKKILRKTISFVWS